MFAGRYVWWMLMAVTAFLFFAVFYPYVVWFFAALTECSATPEGCAGQSAFFNGFLKPFGLTMTAVGVFGCSAARILYLRLAPAWIAAIGIWLVASAGKLMILASLWSGAPRPAVLIETTPQQVLFLAALLVFLAFPIESFKESSSPPWRVANWLAALAAAWSCIAAFAGMEELPALLHRLPGPGLAVSAVEYLQGFGTSLAGMGGLVSSPALSMFIVYFGVLALLVILRIRPAVTSLAPPPAEKPRRRRYPVPLRPAR
ncbi:hypothetical protein ACU5AY_12065 [Rhizobium sp. PAMB 3174]